ncbi:DUF3253 domain-containing protein [Mucilaginibacter psychrotolerans]|uniref:DUF3253 domain-containing protein n=1 Tax=Mucilaginibacter psychrotolerans TaxID=1524096 RepID=A0A4Y8S570_9SPHI|nr:DUF3253 domain-containing protein [Mucilaginibacter psychrotolerans]TFF33886.1 DUF3253 domain-containing protein [Mucilaginibacter psychrotolerans]
MPTIPQAILAKAIQRGPDKSTCPSEIARELFPADWRKHMQEVRDAAIELQQEGKVSITQKGRPVDTENIIGPVRIKMNSP